MKLKIKSLVANPLGAALGVVLVALALHVADGSETATAPVVKTTTALGSEAARAKTLVYCATGSPQGFDPAPYTDRATINASGAPLYNRLVEFERGTRNLIPGLAESWSISDDGMEYTFHLRRGVKFHSTDYFTPTRDLNANDVIFSFLRQWSERHPWHDYNSDSYRTLFFNIRRFVKNILGDDDSIIFWKNFNYQNLDLFLAKIRRDDDYTVTFVLSEPYAPILADLALDFASIVSAEYAGQLEASNSKPNLNTHPVGTGPFQFVAYQPHTEIRYKAHPEYWNGVQAIDDLVFAITPKPAKRLKELKSGECHVAQSILHEKVELFKQVPGIIVLEKVGLNIWYLAYNTQIPPFDNANVRRALNMAINKQGILNSVFRGRAVAAKNPISPALWSYNDSTLDDIYNPTVARALLQREGVSNLKMKVWAEDATDERRIADLLQADFAAIGVEVEIVSYEQYEFLHRSRGALRDGAVLARTESSFVDPFVFLGELGCSSAGGSNLANWCNEEFDDLTLRGALTSDKAERTRLYEQAQTIFKREDPWATIAHEIIFVPMSAKVIGYKVEPSGYHRFDGVGLLE